MRKVLYILGQLEDTDLQWIVDAGSLRSVDAGTEIIQEGVPLESLFIVVSGELTVAKGGQEIARLSIGEIVGDMSFVDGRPATAAVCATPVQPFARC